MSYKRSRGKKERNKRIGQFIIVLAIILIPIIAIFTISPLAPFGEEEIDFYILSGDTIKNFKFERFGEKEIGWGNTIDNNKLKFESEPLWEIRKEDLEILYSKTDEKTGITYIFFQMRFRNTINIYTNLKLGDAVEKMEFKDNGYKALLGTYQHFGCCGGNPLYEFQGIVYYDYWDFGDIISWNNKHSWAGNLEMSFDIADTILPDIFEKDDTGSTWNKEFAYVGVSAVAIVDKKAGKLSEDEPKFYTDTPDYQSDTQNDRQTSGIGTIKGDFKKLWNTDIRIDVLPIPTKQFGLEGVQIQSANTSLSPLQKDGSPTYINTKERQESQKDCKFVLNVGRISPLVKEYSAKLSYNRQFLVTKDYLKSVIPFVWGVEKLYDHEIPVSVIKPQAVHVQNRYFQAELEVVFNVWTAYKIDVLESELDDYDSETPEETYHDLAYMITAEAEGNSAKFETPERTIIGLGLFWDSLIIGIIIISGIIIVIYAFYLIRKRQREAILESRKRY